MQTSQAEVSLLMCNFKCNEMYWLGQLAAPAATPHIHMHTPSNTHTCTLNPCCVWLPKTCYGSRNLTRAQLDTSSSLFFSLLFTMSLSKEETHTNSALPTCLCPFLSVVCVYKHTCCGLWLL